MSVLRNMGPLAPLVLGLFSPPAAAEPAFAPIYADNFPDGIQHTRRAERLSDIRHLERQRLLLSARRLTGRETCSTCLELRSRAEISE